MTEKNPQLAHDRSLCSHSALTTRCMISELRIAFRSLRLLRRHVLYLQDRLPDQIETSEAHDRAFRLKWGFDWWAAASQPVAEPTVRRRRSRTQAASFDRMLSSLNATPEQRQQLAALLSAMSK